MKNIRAKLTLQPHMRGGFAREFSESHRTLRATITRLKPPISKFPWTWVLGFRILAICGLPPVITGRAFPQAWQTVHGFHYVAGQSAANYALAITPTGTLLAATATQRDIIRHEK